MYFSKSMNPMTCNFNQPLFPICLSFTPWLFTSVLLNQGASVEKHRCKWCDILCFVSFAECIVNGHYICLQLLGLYFEVEGQKKKGRLKRMWKKQDEEESVKVYLRRKMHFVDQKGVLGKSDCCWVEVNLATVTCWGYCLTIIWPLVGGTAWL